jgi:hypothetical protein
MISEFNYEIDLKTLETIYNEKYADALLKYLGANEVHCFDYSDYQGATHIHDFNQIIPEKYFGQYTAIIDGGALEHIFNFPIAIENCMQIIKVGGHYLGFSPTNNFMGHGFYQFSPELYFRIFCQENGFRIEHMICLEGTETTKWFRVVDPRDVKTRVGLTSFHPVLLGILAAKSANGPIFSTPPIESTYVSKWKTIDSKVQMNVKKGRSSILKRWIPNLIKNCIKNVIRQNRNLDPAFFKPFDPFATVRDSQGVHSYSKLE